MKWGHLGQRERESDRQTDREIQTDRDREKEREADRNRVRERQRQTDRQTNIEFWEKEIDRQRERVIVRGVCVKETEKESDCAWCVCV